MVQKNTSIYVCKTLSGTMQTQLFTVVRPFHELDQVVDGNVVFKKQTAERIDAGSGGSGGESVLKFAPKYRELGINEQFAVVECIFLLEL